MSERMIRNEMLLGAAALEKLSHVHICVVGLGGVGSWAAETLARAGAGQLTLIDQDSYSESNINRQLGAVTSTIGMPKAEAMANRIADINPACKVHPIIGTYRAEDREQFWGPYDCVVDCIDLVSCKVDLICQAMERQIPIFSALGTGNKLDASRLEVTDLAKTYGCPLARVMRRELGRRGIKHLQVVYSPEEPVYCAPLETPPPGRRSVPGSVPWVPAAAGLLLAEAVVMDLTRELLPWASREKQEKNP